MDKLDGLNLGLGALPMLSNAKTRSISAENPDGAKCGGAKAEAIVPSPADRLGKGWKVRPCIKLPAGSTTALAEIKGPGLITHIWITVDPVTSFRGCVLRMYWDGEKKPSVEVPLGDFFANAHSRRCNVSSLAVCVRPTGGLNCYWPMPFKKSATITIENQLWDDIQSFFYQIDYELREVPAEAAYFHAQWRTSLTTRELPEHTIIDGIKGRGHYVGTALGWTQMTDGWWGEGEIKFYIDGDKEYPTICGTGTEDYFCGAWGFGQTYSDAYCGYPLWEKKENTVPKHGLYRWHIMDPVRFEKDLRVTIQALGWWLNGRFEPLTDVIDSVAYWYQAEPHAAFPTLPDIAGRWPRSR